MTFRDFLRSNDPGDRRTLAFIAGMTRWEDGTGPALTLLRAVLRSLVQPDEEPPR